MQTDKNATKAMQAKNGDAAALHTLYAQNKGIIFLKVQRLLAKPETASRTKAAGVELEDLLQEGYFAMLDAVKAYDPQSGFKFTSYLQYPLMTRCFAALGMRTQRHRREPLNNADSLERPIEEDKGMTVGDFVPDETASEPFERLEQQDYIQRLHADLDGCLSALTERQATTIRARYYGRHTCKVIGAALCVTQESVRRYEQDGMKKLRKAADVTLRAYRDEIITSHCYKATGFSAWKNGGSVEERVVEMMERTGQKWW